MDSNTLIGAGALIYSHNTGRYLFLLRNGDSYNNSWGLAGGKLEAGETIFQGLHREVLEEIGFCDITKLIPIEQFTSDNGKFIYHTFVAVVDDEFMPTLNDEHKGYCWVKLADYPKPLHPGVWRTFNFDDILDKIKTCEFINQPLVQTA
jgi:8-oxo-dGTP pyrophosphatase MutT (NUDIX family)